MTVAPPFPAHLLQPLALDTSIGYPHPCPNTLSIGYPHPCPNTLSPLPSALGSFLPGCL